MTPNNELNLQTWFSVLKAGFGANSYLLSNSLSVTVFRKAFIGAGYANFPFGIRLREDYDLIHSAAMYSNLRDQHVDLLRINFPETLGIAVRDKGIALPEAAITQLQAWSEENLDSHLRYKLRRSRREGVTLRDANINDAPAMHAIYQQTILRHQGNLRYNAAYFHALCAASDSTSGLITRIALTPAGNICGFIVTARYKATAYYLHGGFDEQYSKYRPGFVLMSEVISQARDSGCAMFNFMASPKKQASLINFKEMWGATTQELKHVDHGLSLKGWIANKTLKIARARSSA